MEPGGSQYGGAEEVQLVQAVAAELVLVMGPALILHQHRLDSSTSSPCEIWKERAGW
jgi:hypothetical protein